jgi:ribosome-associated protein
MTTNDAHYETRLLVQAAAQACEDKKALDTRILELDPVDAGLSDFFLITSATNDRQAVAIADEIEHRLKKEFGVMPNSVEGRKQGDWVLLDYFDFVVHVFLSERRAFYDIERLRKSARPLTPAEFDAELKATLAARTRSVRDKASAKKAVAPKRQVGATPAKATTKATAKKAAPKKVAAKTTSGSAAKKEAAKPKANPAVKKVVGKPGKRKNS